MVDGVIFKQRLPEHYVQRVGPLNPPLENRASQDSTLIHVFFVIRMIKFKIKFIYPERCNQISKI